MTTDDVAAPAPPPDPAATTSRWRALRDRTPLRTQLVVSVVALAALTVLVVGGAAVLVLRGYLVDRVDTQLWASLRPLSTSSMPPSDMGGSMGGGMMRGNDDFRPPTIYFGQVYAADGQVLGTLGQGLPRDVVPPQLPTFDPETLDDVAGDPFTVRAADGEAWRVLVLPVARGGVVASVAVGLPLDGVQATVTRLVVIELVVGLVALVLLALLARWVVRASLRPLADVEATAEAIAGGDLSRRVPVASTATEVGRLSQSLNTMLGQIEQAFGARQASEEQARASEERMRRFVGDASHELRTPLTTIRGFAELHRQGAVTDPGEVHELMQRIEGEAERMGLLVDDLLLLARLDQQRPLTREPVDLLALATEAVDDARLLSPDHPVTLEVRADDAPPVVDGDPLRLRQVLTNLVGNAVRHTPAGTPVVVRVGTEAAPGGAGVAVLAVSDDGPGLAADDVERVFERFYRGDPSRTRSDRAVDAGAQAAGGAGLGLAIVAALVAAHGGAVEVESEPGQGATFRVRLPLRPA